MRRRPAIESLANIGRGALFTGNLDRVGDEALLHGVVDLRKTHYRHVHTTLRYGSGGDFRQSARIRVVGIEMIFGCGLTRSSVPHSPPLPRQRETGRRRRTASVRAPDDPR